MAFGDFTVTRASTKLRIGSNGLYGSVANNVPAFEFNTDGTYRGLLVEPGATNQILRSQEFNTVWAVADGATVTADSAVSPDGATTADTINLSTTASSRVQQSSLSLANSTTYTLSVFLKNIALVGGETFQLRLNNGQVAPNNFVINATVDLFAGTVVYSQSGTATTGISGTGSASIQSVGSGWFRISLTATTGTGAVSASSVASLIQPSAGGARSFFAWQAQLETGSVATSPIVTTAGTASRVADVVSLTGASSLIGATEGTLYCEFISRLTSVAQDLFTLGVTADNVSLRVNASNQLQGITFIANAQVANLVSGVTLGAGVSRGAFAYKDGEHALSQNGATPVTSATGSSIPAVLAQVNIGALIRVATFNGWIRSCAIFPTRLPNATLQALTAL